MTDNINIDIESFKLGQKDIVDKLLAIYENEEPYEEIFVCALRRKIKELYNE